MIAIQKLRVTVASNGAFKCNALLVKTVRVFKLVSNISLAPHCLHTEAMNFVMAMGDGSALQFAEGVNAWDIPQTANGVIGPADSFVTAALMLESAPVLGSFRYELVGDASVINGQVVTFDFALEFASENAQNATLSGVTFKDGYTRRYTYTGMEGYHGSIASTNSRHRAEFNMPLTPDKPWRIGVELELYARNREAFNKITGAQSNWFQCERDGSLDERIDGVSGLGIEIKTIPLRACDAKNVDFWQEPMARLMQIAKSKGQTTTGLHVHIGKEILGDNDAERQKTLDKLTWFYYYLIEDVPENHAKNVIICGRERGYSTSPDAGKTQLANFAKKIGFKVVQDNQEVFEEMACTVKEKIRNQRDDINLGHLTDYGTIEFRKGKGCIGKTRMAAIVTWWEQMCLYCRETSPSELNFDAFFQKVVRENPAVAYYFTPREEEA